MYKYKGSMGRDKMVATKVPSIPNSVNEKTEYNCDFTNNEIRDHITCYQELIMG